jgi:RNA polymerase sigma-70 factor (ECF subfamily)
MSVLLGDEFRRVLAAAQAGEEWALTWLFRSLQPAVLRYITARAPWDAEDVAAQVWLEIARALPTFEGDEQRFRAFVFTVAHRRMLNSRRDRARRRVDTVATLAEVCAGDDPAAEVAARLDGDRLARRVVEILPKAHAEIVLLRVVAGLTAEEVAQIVGKRSEHVRVIQHRALRRLAEEFRDAP